MAVLYCSFRRLFHEMKLFKVIEAAFLVLSSTLVWFSCTHATPSTYHGTAADPNACHKVPLFSASAQEAG